MRPGDLSGTGIDIVLMFFVIAALAAITGVISTRYARAMRPLLWLAFAEYLACATWQYFNGADANGYREIGTVLLKFLNASFSWGARENLALLLHQPSAFDDVVIGAGTNTGSMCAIAAFTLFAVGGSAYASQALVAGLALFGALAIYGAFQDAYPDIAPKRLFAATVLFPSVAFWTAALHKEAFCLIGMGLIFAAWRAAYKRRIRALVYAPIGFAIVLMFRAPAMPPMLLGLVLFFVADRLQKAGKGTAVLFSPVYFAVGLGALALGMLVVSRVAPEFALDRVGDTVAIQQKAWNNIANAGTPGGSAFDLDDAAPAHSTSEQLARAPLALVNALFRPQFFDVTNPLVLVSAIEMTAITWLMFRAFRRHGVVGLVARIQQSPFLLMCTVITIVGCTGVGLTTFNFGTMARYRVPFLPFYGALLACLTQETATAPARSSPAPSPPRKTPRRRVGRVAAPTSALVGRADR
jgi:hypothetical protein